MTKAIAFHDARVDAFAGRYRHSRAFRERFSCWKALFDSYVQPYHAIMDLGCGTGVFARYLAEKGCCVTGIDGSEAMIAHCRRQARFAGEQYVCQTLPFDTIVGYPLQDVVLLSSVLEYIPDYMRLLQQANELLRPGGLLLVSVPNKNSLYRRLETLIFRMTNRPRYRMYSRHLFPAKTFSRQVAELNFGPLETHYYGGQRILTPLLRLILPKEYVDTLFVSIYRKEQLPHPPIHENY